MGVSFYNIPLNVKSKSEKEMNLKRKECLICQFFNENQFLRQNPFYCIYAEKDFMNNLEDCGYFVLDKSKLEKFASIYLNQRRNLKSIREKINEQKRGIYNFSNFNARERFIRKNSEGQKTKQLEKRIDACHKRLLDLEFHRGKFALQRREKPPPDWKKLWILMGGMWYIIGFLFWILNMAFFMIY